MINKKQFINLSKNLIVIFFAILIYDVAVAVSPMAHAATSTPSATPEVDKTKQIEDLKERLATKVAQLRQSQRRAVYGTIKSVTVTSATIETTTKDLKIELNDEIKIIQYLKGKRTSLSVDNISKGDVVTVFGEYEAALDLLKAKIIFIEDQIAQRTSGVINDINKTDYTLTITRADGLNSLIDIEKSTKTDAWNPGNSTTTKSGFSKINPGDTIHILGTPVPKKDNQLSAIHILNLGNLSGTASPIPTPTATLSPTSLPAPKTTP